MYSEKRTKNKLLKVMKYADADNYYADAACDFEVCWLLFPFPSLFDPPCVD